MVKNPARSPLWRAWGPAVVWALILVGISGDFGASPKTFSMFKWVLSTFTNLSPQTIKLLHPWFRKSLHVIFYGILSVLWFRALVLTYPEHRGVNLILTLVLTLTVSVLDEGHQYFVHTRTGAFRDVLLDLTGAILFTLAAAGILKRRAPISAGK